MSDPTGYDDESPEQIALPAGGGVQGYGVGLGAFGEQTALYSGFGHSTSVSVSWDDKRWGSDDFLPDGLPGFPTAPVAGVYEVTLNISAAIRNTDDSDITDAPRWWRIAILGTSGGAASGISTAAVGSGFNSQAVGSWNWVEASVSGFGHFDAADSAGVQFEIDGDVKCLVELVTSFDMVQVSADA